MKKYKNFLIEHYSFEREEKEYDGHRNEGTGRYYTVNDIRIIDSDTGKQSSGFNSETEAKIAINKLTSNKRIEKEQKIINKIKQMELKKEEYKRKAKEAESKWLRKSNIIQEYIYNLYKRLPPKLY